MSAQFRQKLVDSLGSKSYRQYAQLTRMFDHGEIVIKRADWALTYNNALKQVFIDNNAALTPDFAMDNFLDSDWYGFCDGLAKRLNNERGVVWLHRGTPQLAPQRIQPNHLQVIYYYVRSTRITEANIDAVAEDLIRKATVDYFKNTNIFKRVQDQIVEEKQVYEHGARSERNATDDAPRTSALTGPGSQIAMRDALDAGVTASGAAGTKTSNQLLGQLQKELTAEYARANWFGVVHSLVKAKFDDLFGFDSDVVDTDSAPRSAVRSQLTLKATMVPDGLSHNPGTFDRALIQHLRNFLENKDDFKNEIMKLVKKGKANPNVLNNIDGLFSASPTPKTRIEKAAGQLAMAGITDQISKKVLRKTSAGKKAEKKWQKKGTSSSKSKTAKGGRHTTKRKKASVKKKRTRNPNQNAIQKNPIALKEILNAKLPEELLKQMEIPRLVNRTGRFRQSAQVTNVMVGPRGGTHIEYTYQKNPYQTFEPGGRQGSTSRDPRRLIGGTVRELAQELMGKKFIRVRSV